MNLFSWLKDNHEAMSSVATLGGAIVFAFALLQYHRAENWKRTEFLAKMYKEFADDLMCQRTMCMLDWSPLSLDLGAPGSAHIVKYSYDLLSEVLRAHKDNDHFKKEEVVIRDTFDRFFMYIEQFERAMQNRVVREKHVYPYFRYWVELLNGKRHFTKSETVKEYLETYGFEDVVRFLDRWNHTRSV